MSFDVLQVRNTARRFLGRHQGLSRRVGYSSKNTKSFRNAVNEDKKAAEITRFRGVDPYSPFYTKPTEEFRGVDSPSAMFRTPDGDDHDLDPNPGYLSKNNPFHDFDPDVRVKDSDEEAVDETSFHDPEDRIFVREDSEVRKLLSDSDDLNEAYVDDIPSKSEKQQDELAGYAENAITSGVDKATWHSQPDVARLALENRGELADRINESDDFRDLLKESPDEVMKDESRERVKELLQEKLRNSGDVLDEEFIDEYPLAALHLLDRPDLVNWVEQNDDYARAYKRDADIYGNEARERLGSEADERVQSETYDEEWFANNQSVAETVWADSLTGHDDKAGTWLDTHEEILPEEAFAPTLTGEYWADIAKRDSGGEGVIPEHLFDSNPSLSMMTALNSEFAESLKNDAEKVTISYPDLSSRNLDTIALRSYGMGLADRTYGDYQRVA